MAKNSRGVCLWLSLAPGEIWRISGGILAEFGYYLNFKQKQKARKPSQSENWCESNGRG